VNNKGCKILFELNKKHPEVTSEHPGLLRFLRYAQECSGILRNTQEYSGLLRLTQVDAVFLFYPFLI